MPDPVKEELERLSEPPRPEAVLTAEILEQPLQTMVQKEAIQVEESATVGDAVALMQQYKFGAILVTNEGKLTGIITERDLLSKVVGVVDKFLELNVTEVMTKNPIALQREDPIVHVMHNMHAGGYRHVPVVDEEGRPLSVISVKDVLRFVLSHFEEEVMNTLAEPYRGPAKVYGG